MAASGGISGVVDLIELHFWGANKDFAGNFVREWQVTVKAAGTVADEGRVERRFAAVEQLPVFAFHAGRGFAIEIELDRLVRRRGRPDAVDDSGAFQVGNDQPIALLADKGIFPGKTVVIAAGAVIAGNGSDFDRIFKAGEQIQTTQFWQTVDRPGVLRCNVPVCSDNHQNQRRNGKYPLINAVREHQDHPCH